MRCLPAITYLEGLFRRVFPTVAGFWLHFVEPRPVKKLGRTVRASLQVSCNAAGIHFSGQACA